MECPAGKTGVSVGAAAEGVACDLGTQLSRFTRTNISLLALLVQKYKSAGVSAGAAAEGAGL